MLLVEMVALTGLAVLEASHYLTFGLDVFDGLYLHQIITLCRMPFLTVSWFIDSLYPPHSHVNRISGIFRLSLTISMEQTFCDIRKIVKDIGAENSDFGTTPSKLKIAKDRQATRRRSRPHIMNAEESCLLFAVTVQTPTYHMILA